MLARSFFFCWYWYMKNWLFEGIKSVSTTYICGSVEHILGPHHVTNFLLFLTLFNHN